MSKGADYRGFNGVFEQKQEQKPAVIHQRSDGRTDEHSALHGIT